ncbi:hypothetical protein K469DRAFT_603534 [Zopfia rhizophila CBS 207.26]|uniref:Chitin-binding type-2 domain-containing protein n=1 Tax=Zopfia rhizophila CBS 207.26 TaxID=1314779 RepID=A0A6A6DEC0_9PEZI|nr:hypothetical protein K469DRAFT_603534 [Zopfia rhizophila CBS 207.26]
MKFIIVSITLFASGITAQGLGDRCSPGSLPSYRGVCEVDTKCTNAGGSYTIGDCPNAPNNVRCCYKAQCYGSQSDCRWTDACTQWNTISNRCPGPANFKCCYV